MPWQFISISAILAWLFSDICIATSPSSNPIGDYRVVIEYFPIISFLVLYRQLGAVLALLEAIGGQRAFLGSIYALTIRYLKTILGEGAISRKDGFEPAGRKTVFWK